MNFADKGQKLAYVLVMPQQERRWLIVSEDGRHVWLGRHTDPSLEEVERAGAALDGQGIAAWLAARMGSTQVKPLEVGWFLRDQSSRR